MRLIDADRLRDEFIRMMTVDIHPHDRKYDDCNQAIFGFRSDGSTYPIWNGMDMHMVLEKFDSAVDELMR